MSQVRLQLNGGEDMSDKQIQEGFDIGECEAPLECALAQGEGECGIKCWRRHGARSISGTDFCERSGGCEERAIGVGKGATV